jgi:hypothetical protein
MKSFPVATLKTALDITRVYPVLLPSADGKITHCNAHAFMIAATLGITKIWGELREAATTANMLIDYMDNHPSAFIKSDDPVEAWKAANDGFLVFAAVKGAAHGHIAPIYPTPGMETSGSWKCQVPFVSNVGKKNAVMGANYAFSKDSRPSYYVVVVWQAGQI